VDMDDDAEDKRRLDRVRVLVKTPWTPTIKHTVEVYIGDERFNVFIVEECGSDSHDCRRSRCSFCESSEEIDSNESYNGSISPRSINTLGIRRSSTPLRFTSETNALMCLSWRNAAATVMTAGEVDVAFVNRRRRLTPMKATMGALPRGR